MKIGILTYQNAINNGAAYQTFGLYKYLSERFPDIEFEIIDYRNEKISNKYSLRYSIFKSKTSILRKIKTLVVSPFIIIQNKRFKKFISKTSLSKKINKKTIKSIDSNYDFFIIGSDQLWNFSINGDDDSYYLPFINDKKRILTYATSMGYSIDTYSAKKEFINSISNFRNLAVREQYVRKQLINYVSREINVVLDPVFLYGEQWLYNRKNRYKNNVSIYIFHKQYLSIINDYIYKFDLKKNKICKICGGINLNDVINVKTKLFLSAGPNEVLDVIYNSKMVFTDSFHCLAMSIIFHKDFIVFLSGNEASDSRIIELLSKCNLSHRIYNKNNYYDNINWNDVDKALNKEINYSKDIIDKIIGDLYD